jgi:beta-xylosidase
MKKLALFLFAFLGFQTLCFTQNPFIRHMYTADPSAHVWKDNRLYVYPSHDVDPPKDADKMDKYHVFSTDDMINWKDHGQILESKQLSWGRTEGGFMWAPDCAYKNQTYYFYFPHPSGTDWNNTWKIGVASSKEPAANFKDLGYIKGIGGFAMIDPCVYIDDDGQAYMIYGGGSKCHGGKLKDNMIEIDGEMKEMTGLTDFHEAPWLFKRRGVYYLVYPDNTKGNNKMLYAMSKNPLGPWDYKGVLLEGTGCNTSHGSVVEFKDKWYLFYHNKALSGKGNLRSICFDPVTFNEDGTMNTVIQTGSKELKK